METLIALLLCILICICYLGIGFLFAAMLEIQEVVLSTIKIRKPEKAEFILRFLLVFGWPIFLFSYISGKYNTTIEEIK
ncbi:MAG: hypothetical protein WC264_01690 [Candidatus Paceibacterota bacterium]